MSPSRLIVFCRGHKVLIIFSVVIAFSLGANLWMNSLFTCGTRLRSTLSPAVTSMGTSPHCALWSDNQDEWWQSHPEWEVSLENATHLCFSLIPDLERAFYFRQIHDAQFVHCNCSDKFQNFHLGLGFGAAMQRLTSSFYWTRSNTNKTYVPSKIKFKHRRGFVWMYNEPYDESDPTRFGACPSQDMFCYFLPITNCDYDEGVSDSVSSRRFVHRLDVTKNSDRSHDDLAWHTRYRYHVTYFTRLRQETRRRLYILMQEIAPPRMPSNCFAFHVRRTDATTEKFKRSFHPLASYIAKASVTPGSDIVLLTDDQSTIEEANILHPEYNWYYINRTRYFGAQQRNHHFPSGDKALEFLNIYADLRMARPCDVLVHGTSSMVSFIVHAMEEAHGRLIRLVNVEVGDDSPHDQQQGQLFTEELKKKLENARQHQL